MRITKDGKVKLEKGEVRIGNFFFRDEGENEHIKVTDLNSCFTIRVLKRMPIGIWLENVIEMSRTDEVAVNTLKTWVSVMWSLLSVVPDDDFVKEIIGATEAALKRHQDWYGYNPSDDDAENKDAPDEVREMKEFEEAVRNLPDEN